MRSRNLLILTGVFILFVLDTSCTRDGDPLSEYIPDILKADNKWLEDEIITNEVIWYKVIADETFTTLYIEWAEAGNHGESRSYTGDIKVSAYMLDGETAYFENKNNGYGNNIRSLQPGSEYGALLKVELNDETKPGTYAIRSTGTSAGGEIEYLQLDLGDSWTEASIAEDQIIGYTTDCGVSEKVKIIWAELDSPEEGYTAEIMGSVMHLDGETPYRDIANGKDILNKNKSHSDDPKSIEVDPAEKIIKIHIQVNSSPGSYAIKVVPM